MRPFDPQPNATPLIDVLLVLFVMLIFSLPIATHSILLSLPHGRPHQSPPSKPIDIDIDFDGRVYWNGKTVRSDGERQAWIKAAVRADPAVKIKVWPQRYTRYERVAQVLAAGQRSRVTNLGLAPIPD